MTGFSDILLPFPTSNNLKSHAYCYFTCSNLENKSKYLTKSDIQLNPKILRTKNDKKVL